MRILIHVFVVLMCYESEKLVYHDLDFMTFVKQHHIITFYTFYTFQNRFSLRITVETMINEYLYPTFLRRYLNVVEIDTI